ncbi:hypothetical protein SVA_1746 [Sulfurifustis variabilis]|uniref:DUF302 domain-containing protein n=1 Tax=Sulfurifustis variabilis TaxID=1675686 RepID=A0A1B4V432_9GAMM|nr:DUF302 domain-containing protein [Sulfurifustis variabilis]BAU48300.1 hypothetical protein SVA_1746 [Sulfurifustis variabilis]
MIFFRNVLASIGAAALALLLVGGARLADVEERMKDFDPKARVVYEEMADILIETGSAAQATVWKIAVDEGLTPEDVEEAMKSAAIERNILDVGELPLYKQVEASSGEPYRFVKIYMFCNALTAKRMIDYDAAFSAYLPCRVTLLEEPDGKLWLYTLNMDMMIHGGKPLPPDLYEEAVGVRDTILAIMQRGAKGAF